MKFKYYLIVSIFILTIAITFFLDKKSYNDPICNELAGRLDDVAMNLEDGDQFIGGILKNREFYDRHYGGLIEVEKLTFKGIGRQLEIERINESSEFLQIGKFYKFNLNNIKLYDPLAGSSNSESLVKFSNKELNRLEEITCEP